MLIIHQYQATKSAIELFTLYVIQNGCVKQSYNAINEDTLQIVMKHYKRHKEVLRVDVLNRRDLDSKVFTIN